MLDSTISEQKPSKMTENSEEIDQKPSNLTENVFPSMIVKNVYEAIKQNRKAKYSWLQDNLGVSESTVQRAIDELKKLGYISSERAKIKGEWQLLKKSYYKNSVMEIRNLMTFDDRAGLRRWLEENHGREQECWVACYRGNTAMTGALPYVEVVLEALCFGWIDSTVKKMPDGRLAQRISPRRKNSHWTELNIQRCQELERQGLMTDAGHTALPQHTITH